MDGRSCGLEGAAPAVLKPGGVSRSPTSAAGPGSGALPRSRSPTSAAGPGSGAPPRCVSVNGTCEAARCGACPLEAHVCTCFSESMNLQAKKGLQKCATFPPSAGEAQQPDHSDNGLKASPAYERSISLPATSKLISAMKGGREKNGMALPTENRHVKWAPDVYDPPVTSVCHSVNSSSYKRRAKARKKEKNKQKKKHKGKSKKTNQNCIQNSSLAPDLGSKAVSTTGGRSSADDPNRDEAVLMDYNMGNQEAKCGSSFLRESVAKMHFSVAEAS
ncbi:hypothetical protein U9M48_041592 [Paspalum notatum var. saurae]|uniref:BRI1-KD interacting protein 130 n=1 Tax=Paspalum notatum var. saurae TaxID=547442 RepID=A0AAQ3UQS9_PASNO